MAYQINDEINVYAKISEGYASGVYNPGTVIRQGFPADTEYALTPANPEETIAYELGMKSQLLDNRLRLNTAVFYNDNDNLQSTDFVDGVRQTINTGKSSQSGIEIDAMYIPIDGLMIDANYGYIHSDVDNYVDPTNGEVKPRYVTTPHNTGSLGVQYDYGINLGLLSARLDATYSDRQGFSTSDNRVEADARTLLNGRLAISEVALASGDLAIALWGKNLADEEYIEHGTNFGYYIGYTWGTPRTYGMDVTYNF